MEQVKFNFLKHIDNLGQKILNRPAYICHDCSLTYEELLNRANSLASHIANIIPDDGSPVLVYGHKETEMPIAFLGTAKSGHPYIPVDSSVPEQRVSRIREISGSKLTLTPNYVSRLKSDGPDIQSRTLQADTPYYVMFTSGSTGEPKGVIITAGCLASYLSWMLGGQPHIRQDEVILNQAPFSFDLSIGDLYLSLMTGSTLFSITAEDIVNPPVLFKRIYASGITVWSSTPSFVRLCLADRNFNGQTLPDCHLFLLLGETLSPQVAMELLTRFPRAEIWNTYGPTETTVAMTSVRIDKELLAKYPELPIGRPMPDVDVFIMNEAGQNVPPDVKGEIIIAGPDVSPGYIGRPDLTKKAFFELAGRRAYRTGDLGHYHDGFLFFDGRVDGQIKIRGNRIEIGDIEANLRSLPEIRDAVVLPVGKDGTYDSLAAFVILRDKPDGLDFEISQKLRTQLARRLPYYMLPRRFYFCEEFPLNTNGKADRRKLRETFV